jgi:hypothetical protein
MEDHLSKKINHRDTEGTEKTKNQRGRRISKERQEKLPFFSLLCPGPLCALCVSVVSFL